MQGDYFFSQTTSSDGSTIKNADGRLPVSETVFHTPGNALRLQYHNVTGGDWEAAVYYSVKRGMDHFKSASFLSFWIYSDSEITSDIELPQLQFMRRDSSLFARLQYPAYESQQMATCFNTSG